MRLDALVAGANAQRIAGEAGVEVASLAYDTRRVGPGCLFFCVKGEKVDGHDLAAAAVESGAVALVVERELDVDVPQAVVASARAAMAPVAARFWEEPTRELTVIGVTGTNGKTTTAFLAREILGAAGIQCGLLGTVKQVVGGVEEEVERTTPEAIDLQSTFRRMVDSGDRACVMEVSSHALALHRSDAIDFDVAVFTNLTQDHLDFHADMEDYFHAKRRLFEMGPKVAVVNVGDPYGRRLAGDFECLTFSAEGGEADIAARDVSLTAAGAEFEAVRKAAGPRTARGSVAWAPGAAWPPSGAVRIATRLPGHFNVANALGAFSAAIALGIDPGAAAAALAGAPAPPGRFEPVDEGQPFTVLVDYAHTPDSLENALRAARRLTSGRLITVFGAGGDRDRGKRPLMGRAASELSDLSIVTSDNPRSEDPQAIIAEILGGMRNGGEAHGAGEVHGAGEGGRADGMAGTRRAQGPVGVAVEPDRRAAIALALAEAGEGDTVLIAGKGHEQGQEFEGGRKLPFDDREVAREELRRL